MDQRRFILFLLLSLSTLVLVQWLLPPPPLDPVDPVDRVAEEVAPPEVDPAVRPPDDVPLAERLAPVEDVPAEFFTLGSLDPESGYRMLPTFTNTGAAVHRVELSSPRYRDQHNRSGYLGELELRSAEGGVEAQVVGHGTPAWGAGLQVGDVIVAIDGTPINHADELAAVLANTRPADRVTLDVRRDGVSRHLTATLIRRPFAMLRPEIENYQMREKYTQRDVVLPPDFVDRPSFLVTLAALGGRELEDDDAEQIAEVLEKGNWQVGQQTETSIEFIQPLEELGLSLVKRYTLAPVPAGRVDEADYPGYHLALDLELHNTGEEAQSLAYRLDGPTGMPLEGWWYAHKISRQRWFGGAGLRDVVVRFFDGPTTQIDGPAITEGKAPVMGHGRSLAYVGVDGQYFSAVLIPKKETRDDVWFDTTEAITVGPAPGRQTPVFFTNVTCRLTRETVAVAAGAVHRDSFEIFLGPKRPDLLRRYQAAGDPQYSLEDVVYYGLALFGSVARAMLFVLHFFHGMVGNYGLAIIMLTVLVRGLMFPLSYKQTQNMARLQALKPEMDRITEKYKTDMQKRSQAMQELYRKHNINPLGGCLPVFIQLPIFIGLYRALMVDVELRDSPAFGEWIRWCSNLAAPDMFINWSWIMPDVVTRGYGMFALGPYLNILPLVTVALFLITQKMMMPAPTNEQAALQQKMMKYMTIFIGILFYKVASGLCIYFTASSLWGIAERKLLPKHTPADAAGPTPPSRGKQPDKGPKAGPSSGPKPGPNGSPKKKRRSKTKRKR